MISPQELAALVAEFGKAYTRKIFTEMGRAGTTPARARLLMTLQCHGASKMADLSAHLDVTPRSVTKLVDGLEAEGLLVREAHPDDRRITMIRITPNGMHVCKESALANHAAVAALYEKLPESDRKQLARILKKMIDLLHEQE
jgi:DNA-binding MarR family transcriptional regulator